MTKFRGVLLRKNKKNFGLSCCGSHSRQMLLEKERCGCLSALFIKTEGRGALCMINPGKDIFGLGFDINFIQSSVNVSHKPWLIQLASQITNDPFARLIVRPPSKFLKTITPSSSSTPSSRSPLTHFLYFITRCKSFKVGGWEHFMQG